MLNASFLISKMVVTEAGLRLDLRTEVGEASANLTFDARRNVEPGTEEAHIASWLGCDRLPGFA